jgi:hypothetical protein
MLDQSRRRTRCRTLLADGGHLKFGCLPAEPRGAGVGDTECSAAVVRRIRSHSAGPTTRQSQPFARACDAGSRRAVSRACTPGLTWEEMALAPKVLRRLSHGPSSWSAQSAATGNYRAVKAGLAFNLLGHASRSPTARSCRRQRGTRLRETSLEAASPLMPDRRRHNDRCGYALERRLDGVSRVAFFVTLSFVLRPLKSFVFVRPINCAYAMRSRLHSPSRLQGDRPKKS